MEIFLRTRDPSIKEGDLKFPQIHHRFLLFRPSFLFQTLPTLHSFFHDDDDQGSRLHTHRAARDSIQQSAALSEKIRASGRVEPCCQTGASSTRAFSLPIHPKLCRSSPPHQHPPCLNVFNATTQDKVFRYVLSIFLLWKVRCNLLCSSFLRVSSDRRHNSVGTQPWLFSSAPHFVASSHEDL